MSDTFLSQENKGLIWQLLSESNSFSNIPDEYFGRVKNLFETTLIDVSTRNQNLTDKNKTVIIEMIKKLPFLKNQTLTKPLEEVKVQISKEFEDKKDDFISLINHAAPKEPNFTDDSGEKRLDPTSMNNMLNKMMATREKELNQIMPPAPQQEPIKETSNTSHGGTCTDYIWGQWGKETNKAISSKKVSFSDNNFISRLKIKEATSAPPTTSAPPASPISKPVQEPVAPPPLHTVLSQIQMEEENNKPNISEDKMDVLIASLKFCISNQEKILTQLKALQDLIT